MTALLGPQQPAKQVEVGSLAGKPACSWLLQLSIDLLAGCMQQGLKRSLLALNDGVHCGLVDWQATNQGGTMVLSLRAAGGTQWEFRMPGQALRLVATSRYIAVGLKSGIIQVREWHTGHPSLQEKQDKQPSACPAWWGTSLHAGSTELEPTMP